MEDCTSSKEYSVLNTSGLVINLNSNCAFCLLYLSCRIFSDFFSDSKSFSAFKISEYNFIASNLVFILSNK